MAESISGNGAENIADISAIEAVEREAPIAPLASAEKCEKIAEKKGEEATGAAHVLKNFLECGGRKEEYRRALIRLYGEKLVAKSFPDSWDAALSQEHCVEILERLGHSLTLDDLEDIFAELRSGKIERKILKYPMGLYNYICFSTRMYCSPSFRDLSPYWQSYLVDLIRNPVRILELGTISGERSCVDRGFIRYTQYIHQLAKLQESGDRSRPEFFLASRELLARSVAYAAPRSVYQGAILPIFNEKLGRPVLYTLKDQLNVDGLHVYLFTPLEKREDLPAQLIFRGTNGYASTGRDLDATGIGKKAFRANLASIESLMQQAGTKSIEVVGHSLGAVDAQRAVALLARPGKRFNFEEISLYAFCAPRIEIERVREWKSDLKALAQEESPPTIRLNFAYHENDAVTWIGDSYLPGANLNFIYSNYLTVSSQSGMMSTVNHHIIPFFQNGNFNFDVDGRTFELRKSFPDKELESELQKLQDIKNSWQWWRGIKSYFVQLESEWEVRKRIEEMRRHELEISQMEEGSSQRSWVVYSGMSAIRYTVQPVIYHFVNGLLSLRYWRS